jgi:hypothetical protein
VRKSPTLKFNCPTTGKVLREVPLSIEACMESVLFSFNLYVYLHITHSVKQIPEHSHPGRLEQRDGSTRGDASVRHQSYPGRK